MESENQNRELKGKKTKLRKRYFLLLMAFVIMMFLLSKFNLFVDENPNNDGVEAIQNGIHVQTGLKDAEGLNMVIANCTGCHSAQLVIQNRMNKEHWNATIRWMQETQNLWDLGENQEVIVNYLVTNYPVLDKGRRANLKSIEWYELKE